MFFEVFMYEVSNIPRLVCKQRIDSHFVFLTEFMYQTSCFTGKNSECLCI